MGKQYSFWTILESFPQAKALSPVLALYCEDLLPQSRRLHEK